MGVCVLEHSYFTRSLNSLKYFGENKKVRFLTPATIISWGKNENLIDEKVKEYLATQQAISGAGAP